MIADTSPEPPEVSARDHELQYGAGTYLKRDLNLVRGDGVFVHDDKGNSYIDCIAGIATCSLGHAHPALVKSISEQAGTLISAPELLCTPHRAKYQELLLREFPESFNRVFLCNSGTEAFEAALKFARFSTGKPGILGLKKGFHGKTMGSLSVTSEEKYRKPFAPLLPHVHHLSTDSIEQLESFFQEHGTNIGCFVFEAVQGEGGVRPLSVEFVQKAVSLARDVGALVIADEVQCGFGRTGKMWGFQHLEVEPDIVCMAKGIAGGVPMGAVAIGKRVKELEPQSHTSTFGGNPLACRAATTVLEVIRQDSLVDNARLMGDLIQRELTSANLKLVREIRGRGLMIGIELKRRAGKYVQDSMERGLLCLLAGQRVIRLLPPLTLQEQEAREIVSILVSVLSDSGDSA